ncbi:trehalose-phosphatase [Lichenibacterium dinghuense]|uniref:trehalose-phosphatase n=1 Tax=Lichenibacterium dinghuense TaxID=2895977 RepID=UPI001EFFDB5C|nr:trehalose-phosphatase [Lichenibacterium sp. 6Y81]
MPPELPPPDACLFLDVDGTLVDIAPTPDAVRLAPGLLDDLAAAERICGGALALVSGRSIAQLDAIFAPRRFTASGVHGAEFRHPDGMTARAAEPIPRSAWDDLAVLLGDFPASFAEDKGFSFAVHHRAAPDTGPRLRAALEVFLAARPGLGLAILPGHFVFELKRPGVDKGGAIARLMERAPFAGRCPVFVGDDVTDLPGFAAVEARGGAAYAVGRDLPGARGTFADPAAVRAWLGAFVRRGAAAA